ncbi:MAG: type III pantothenate kinase [Bacteroidales bacterium]|jgi:type III pantothenate kinase
MKNLVIDAGNTLIKIAVYNSADLVTLESHAGWSADDISSLLSSHPDIKSCLICSTREVPGWLRKVIEKNNISYHELSHRLPLPIRIGYETPETLGNDRIAAAAGAADRFPGQNVLAIDAGTALTIDLVSSAGLFEGGNISPGMRMRFSALHQQTFSLPDIAPDEVVPLIGKNTRDAILAGVINGLTYEIDNSINSLKNKYNDLQVIMTGGDAPFLSKRLKNTIFVEENLVLSGLNAILRNFSL